MENNQYLGTEKVSKLLAQFAIPCIFSLIISCLYNIVDQIFVGNGIGYLGNAATGVIFPITVVGWGLSLFFGDGAAAHLSVALGRNETETIHRGVGNAVLCSFLSGVVIIAISYACGDHLLGLIGATDANMSMAHDYGFIIYAMMPLALVQNTLASIIRADGSPRYAMGAMLAGAVINIIGDPVTIFGLHMGIKGAAYATILGQFVSFLICAAYLTRSKTFHICAASFRLDTSLLKRIMALGTSSLLTQLSIVIITIINNILLVRYGAVSVYGADEELYTQFAVACLRIYLSLIIFTCVQKVCAIFLQSIGQAKFAAPLSVLRDVFLIVLSLIVPIFLGVTGIFWAAPVADILAIAITAVVMVRIWNQLKEDKSESFDKILPEFPAKAGVVVTISREHGSAGKRVILKR